MLPSYVHYTLPMTNHFLIGFLLGFPSRGTLFYVHSCLSVSISSAGLLLQQAETQRLCRTELLSGSLHTALCLGSQGNIFFLIQNMLFFTGLFWLLLPALFRHMHLCYKWSPKIRAYQYWLWAQSFFHCIQGASTFCHLIYFPSFWLYSANWLEGHSNKQKLRNRSPIKTFYPKIVLLVGDRNSAPSL